MCTVLYRLRVGRVVELLPSAVFLLASKRVLCRPLRECSRLVVGAVSPVFWAQDVFLSVENGLHVNGDEELAG